LDLGDKDQAVESLKAGLRYDKTDLHSNKLLSNLLITRRAYEERALDVEFSANQRQTVRGLAFSADGKHLLALYDDSSFRKWNWRAGTIIESRLTQPTVYKPKDVGLVKETQNIVAAGEKLVFRDSEDASPDYESALILWNENQDRSEKIVYSQSARGFAILDSAGVIAGYEGPAIRLYDPSNLDLLREVTARKQYKDDILNFTTVQAIADDGLTFVIEDDDRKYYLAETATGRILQAIDERGVLIRFTVSPKGTLVTISDEAEMAIRVYNDSGKPVDVLRAHSAGPDFLGGAGYVVFSQDGKLFATYTTATDGAVLIWDAATRRLVHTLDPALLPALRGVWSCKFSPDGKFLATSWGDGSIRVWSTQSGVEVITLYDVDEPARPTLSSLAIVPGRKFAASGEGLDWIRFNEKVLTEAEMKVMFVGKSFDPPLAPE
jgi:WD40 repeat protein